MNDYHSVSSPEPSLVRYAAHLTRRADFMAGVLQQYREQEGLAESALAAQLAISPAMYVRLAMCRRPISDPAHFATQVRQIAAYVGCDPAQLAQIVRQVDAVAAIRPVADAPATDAPPSVERSSTFGLLAAARDHTAQEDDSAAPADEPDVSTHQDPE